jgi:D-alanine-D-alanine ligase
MGHVKVPCIVKPVYQGHSLGVSLVNKRKDLITAVNKAFLLSSKILIQEYIEGRELTVGVLDIGQGKTKVLPIVELKMKRSIQSVEVKEKIELQEAIVPALLKKKERELLENQALELFKSTGCLGVSRFDVRRNIRGKFYFLENNTCPGMYSLEESDLPKQLKAAEISMGKFVEYMIKSGLRRKQNISGSNY